VAPAAAEALSWAEAEAAVAPAEAEALPWAEAEAAVQAYTEPGRRCRRT